MSAHERELERQRDAWKAIAEASEYRIKELEQMVKHARLEGYVYVIEWSNGWVKIGSTMYPEKRLSDHRRDKKKMELTIKRSWVSKPFRGYIEIEKAAHREFAKNIVSAETFVIPFDEAVFFVNPDLLDGLETCASTMGQKVFITGKD